MYVSLYISLYVCFSVYLTVCMFHCIFHSILNIIIVIIIIIITRDCYSMESEGEFYTISLLLYCATSLSWLCLCIAL